MEVIEKLTICSCKLSQVADKEINFKISNTACHVKLSFVYISLDFEVHLFFRRLTVGPTLQ